MNEIRRSDLRGSVDVIYFNQIKSNGRMVSALTHDSYRVCGHALHGAGTKLKMGEGGNFLDIPLHFFCTISTKKYN